VLGPVIAVSRHSNAMSCQSRRSPELPVTVGPDMVGVAPVEGGGGVLEAEPDELVEVEDEEPVGVGVAVVPAGRVEVVLVVGGVGVGDDRPPHVHTPSSPSGI